MFVTTKRRVVEEEVTEFIDVKEREKQIREKMRYERNRLNSFPVHWLYWIGLRQRFAKAGFYYDSNDNIRCYSCGLIEPWRGGHDLERIHRTKRPNCDFFKGDNIPLNRYKYTPKTVPAPGKRQGKETNRKLKAQTKNNTYSENQNPKETKEGNTERKNNSFSPRFQPASVETGEPDNIPTTCNQQRPSSVRAESNTEKSIPKGSAKVRVSQFFLNLFYLQRTDSHFCIT